MAFDINKFLNPESKKDIKNDFKTVKISIHKLRPAPDKENFYHIDDEEVETTARTIELVGIQQNFVVKPIKDTDEFEIIVGHKRRLSILKLLAEGKTEYELVPCKIEETGDDIRSELILIFTNSTQRDRTDYERMKEIKRVKELLIEYQKDNKLPGKKQNIIAAILGTSKSQVGRLENIDHNLIEEFKTEFATGRINLTTANEIAGMPEEEQREVLSKYQESGNITYTEIKELKKEPEGQQEPPEEPQEEEIQETTEESTEEMKKETEVKSEDPPKQQEYFNPEPLDMTSKCYDCANWNKCSERSTTVTACNEYQNKNQLPKTNSIEQTSTSQPIQTDNIPQKPERVPQVHDIKTARMFFSDIKTGIKPFELRKNDRDYRVGDTLHHMEYFDGEYTGEELYQEITYKLEDYTGLTEGYCILGTKLI